MATIKAPIIEDASLVKLPMFPLPEVHLFPGAILPLHVFEPRYLALVDQVLERPTIPSPSPHCAPALRVSMKLSRPFTQRWA